MEIGTSKLRRKRKFPGPAGLLPDINPDKVSLLSKTNPLSEQVSQFISSSADIENSTLETTMSQSSSQSDKEQNLLVQPPWVEMQSLLRAEESKLNSSVLKDRRISEMINIKWILTKALVLPLGNRVPFLVAVLDSTPEIQSTNLNQRKTQCIQLKDESGSIEAALDPDIVIQYGKELHRGTAIALKNVGLMFHKRKLIVTITGKNLIFLTSSQQLSEDTPKNGFCKSANTSKKSISCVKQIINNEGVRVFKFCDYIPDKIMENYNRVSDLKVMRQELSDLNKNSTNLARNANRFVMPKPSLFSNIILPTSEDSQDIDFNFDDDDEGDEFFVGINDDLIIGETDRGKSTQSNSIISNEIRNDNEGIRLANLIIPGSDQHNVNANPEMEDDEFDAHLASFCEDTETIERGERSSTNVRENSSTAAVNVSEVFEDDFSDIGMEIENF